MKFKLLFLVLFSFVLPSRIQMGCFGGNKKLKFERVYSPKKEARIFLNSLCLFSGLNGLFGFQIEKLSQEINERIQLWLANNDEETKDYFWKLFKQKS